MVELIDGAEGAGVPVTGGDWRVVGGRQCAWFGASSHAHAASLAGSIADLLPAGSPLPDLDVRGDGVRVRVPAGAPAPAISDRARALGLVPDPAVLQEMRLRVDSPSPAAVTSFWQQALDYVGTDPLGDRWRRCPVIRFERSDEDRPLRNRFHVDLGHPGPTADTVAALRAAGGRVAVASEWYSTVADHDGNEVDIVPGGALGEESTSDWRVQFGAMACYPGATPRQAAEVAAEAGRLADRAGIPLMIDLRPEGVAFDSGKDQWEVVDGFVDLAAAVQVAARAAGLTADPGALRFVQVMIDAVDVPAVRDFWCTVLGYVPAPDTRFTDLYDPRQLNPVLLFQPMEAEDTDRRRQRSRVHIELLVPADQLRGRVDAAVAAGGRLLDDGRLADPEGNEVTLHPGS